MDAPIIGEHGRDRVTGFCGLVTGRAEYLAGEPRLLLEGRVGDDGKTRESWFAASRVEPWEAAGK